MSDGDDPGESPTEELRRAADLTEIVGLHRAKYDRAGVLERVGLDGIDTRRWWRAMGIVEVPDDVVAFSRDDIYMARALVEVLLQDEHSEQHIFRLARLLGGSSSRIAEAQSAVLEDVLSQLGSVGPLDSPANRLAALQTPEASQLLDVFETSLLYVWRRHLFAALARWVGADDDQAELAVGFADISGFSAMSKRLHTAELAEVIERFEAQAIDVVSAHDGRVVKFIGDEAFYVVDDVPTAVDVALELCERMAEGDDPIPLHCGIAQGPTVTIGGDVFGNTVNLAKRLTTVARRNKVVLTKEAARELDGRDDLVTHRVPRVFELKGIGREQLVSVTRRPEPEPEPEPESGGEGEATVEVESVLEAVEAPEMPGDPGPGPTRRARRASARAGRGGNDEAPT